MRMAIIKWAPKFLIIQALKYIQQTTQVTLLCSSVTRQWGTGEIINSYSLTINLQISANILIVMPIDVSNNSNVYAIAWDATVRNAVRLFCANNGPSNLVGYIAICR